MDDILPSVFSPRCSLQLSLDLSSVESFAFQMMNEGRYCFAQLLYLILHGKKVGHKFRVSIFFLWSSSIALYIGLPVHICPPTISLAARLRHDNDRTGRLSDIALASPVFISQGN